MANIRQAQMNALDFSIAGVTALKCESFSSRPYDEVSIEWLKMLTKRAVYPLISYNFRQPLGTGVLFHKQLLDTKKELYFGLTTKRFAESFLWPNIFVEGHCLPIVLLDSSEYTFSDKLVVFAFAAPYVCHTIPLIGSNALLDGSSYHVAGFSDVINDNQSFLHVSKKSSVTARKTNVGKRYFHISEVEERKVFTAFSGQGEDSSLSRGYKAKSSELLLKDTPSCNAMMGGAVVSSDGRLAGLLNYGLTNNRVIAIDLRSFIDEIFDLVVKDGASMSETYANDL